MFSKIQEFKLYLKARLQFLEQQQGQNEQVDNEVDMAHSELMHIFSVILPVLEEEYYEKIRDIKRK